ncbi:MAG: hypothetical protein KAT25_04225 [Sulfuriflexus sp.]|nr:hypothetical protein [Sulfuriflexus sp.]
MRQTYRQTNLSYRMIIHLFIGLLGLLVSTHTIAGQSDNIYSTQIHIGSDGLAILQPSISQTEILDTLTQAHRLLTAQEVMAKAIVDEHDAGKDMIVAAIMPGGLLYLAYKKGKFENAKTELTQIENELTNLDTDAVTLYKPVYNTIHQPILIARYP